MFDRLITLNVLFIDRSMPYLAILAGQLLRKSLLIYSLINVFLYCYMAPKSVHYLYMILILLICYQSILIMKLFKTNNINIIEECRVNFGVILPSSLIPSRTNKFMLKMQFLDNSFCSKFN